MRDGGRGGVGGAGPLLAVVAALTGLGLVMVLSSSSVTALRDGGSSWLYFQRQAMWVAAGTGLMVLAARVDYHRWRQWGPLLLGGSVVALAVVLVPGIGVSVNGSRRWLAAGPVGFQPSEVAKLAVLVFAADLLARRADRVRDPSAALVPVMVVLAGVGALVMLEPDMGTTSIIVLIAGAVLFAGGVPVPTLAGIGGLGLVLGAFLAMAEPYRRARVTAFIDPWADASNTGYQVVQSLVGMGSGHLTGVGLGASRAKWGFLPNAHTDFIYAIVGEELGLLGSLGVLALFVAFLVVGLRVAAAAPDRFGALLATGVTAWVVGQALVNIGAVIGLLPVTGVPMPFVSFGGSSLLVTMVATGVLVNVARAPLAAARPPRPAASRP